MHARIIVRFCSLLLAVQLATHGLLAQEQSNGAASSTPATTEPGAAVPAQSPPSLPTSTAAARPTAEHDSRPIDYFSHLFVFVLATFIGLGVVVRVSRLLHTPLMSLTNAISGIAVVGSIIVAGSTDYPPGIRLLGVVALFASMTNVVSGFLITDRMLKMFKQTGRERQP